MWGYRQVMTMAQIELLARDIPVVAYKKEKGARKHTRNEMEELTRRWEEKRRKEGERKISLNEFLRL